MAATAIKVNIAPALTAIKHAEAMANAYHNRFGEMPELPKDMVEYHREPYARGKTILVAHPSNDLIDMILLMRQAIYGEVE